MIYQPPNSLSGVMHSPGCTETLPADTELLKTPNAKRQRLSFQYYVGILQVSTILEASNYLCGWSLFLRQVLQPAVERDTAQFYTPGWLQAQSPVPKCTWWRRSCPLRWKPRQEVWLHFSTDFSHYLPAHCHKTQGSFMSLFYPLTAAVLGKQYRG